MNKEKFKSHLSSLINLSLVLFAIMMIGNSIPRWINNYKLQGSVVDKKLDSLTILDGTPITLPLKNHAHAIIFWATWCGPCKIELGRIQDAIDEGELPADRIFAINLGENINLVKSHVAKEGYEFITVTDPSSLLAKMFSVQVTPTTILIESDSQISWVGSGISPTILIRLKDLFKN